MDAIVRPQIALLKVEIRKDLAKTLGNLQNGQRIRQAWSVALGQRLSKAKIIVEASLIMSSTSASRIRKELETVWSPVVAHEVIDNCFAEIINQVLGSSKYINVQKDTVGVVLFPSMWQAAVDESIRLRPDSKTRTPMTTNIHVTAADADGARLKGALPTSLIKLCNEHILKMLCGPEIWDNTDILQNVLVPHLASVVDRAYIQTLQFMEEQGDRLIQHSIVPVSTSALLEPTIHTYRHDCQVQFGQIVRRNLSREGGTAALASALGDQTRRKCRYLISSAKFQEGILQHFIQESTSVMSEEKERNLKHSTTGILRRMFQR